MARNTITLPNTFATAPAAPATESSTLLDQNYSALLAGFTDSSNGYVNAYADSGVANTYAVTIPAGIAPSGYTNGFTVVFMPGNSNSGASTLNINSLGSVPLVTASGGALATGAIVAGTIVWATYYGGNFYVFNPPSTSSKFFNTTALVAGSTTYDCTSLQKISISYNAAGAPNSGVYTLNVTNVQFGAHFDVAIFTAGNGQVFRWTGTNQNAGAISNIWSYYPGTAINLVSTGNSAPVFVIHQGMMTTATGGIALITVYA